MCSWDQTQFNQWSTQDYLTWYQTDASQGAEPAAATAAGRVTAKQIIKADAENETDFPTIPLREVCSRVGGPCVGVCVMVC